MEPLLYLAIGRALDIRERLDRFCRQHKAKDSTDSLLKDDLLSRTHWHQLDRLHDCLKVFEVSTLYTEGKNSLFCDWFPTLDFMLSTVDDFKKEFQIEAEADRTLDYLS